PKYLVVDPVMISKSGYYLLKPEAKENLIKYLIPLAYIITPNIPEAEEITGIKIHNVDDMKRVGEEILQLGPKFVLMKGGH
ncbi:PfkB family carbohydrate kinase, partial [Clostridioides difficile]